MAASPYSQDYPDPALLTKDELLDLWAGQRNSHYGVVLAEEMMRRISTERQNGLSHSDAPRMPTQ
jgi:hypothetical protein